MTPEIIFLKLLTVQLSTMKKVALLGAHSTGRDSLKQCGGVGVMIHKQVMLSAACIGLSTSIPVNNWSRIEILLSVSPIFNIRKLVQ